VSEQALAQREHSMVRLDFSIELSYEIDPPGCDLIFNIQAAHTPQQTVVSEQLALSQQLLQTLLFTVPGLIV
jgi:hypothetical protein